jgi:hypothetical protein
MVYCNTYDRRFDGTAALKCHRHLGCKNQNYSSRLEYFLLNVNIVSLSFSLFGIAVVIYEMMMCKVYTVFNLSRYQLWTFMPHWFVTTACIAVSLSFRRTTRRNVRHIGDTFEQNKMLVYAHAVFSWQ